MRSTVHSHSRHADALEAAFRWNHKLDGCLARLKAILRNCGRSIIVAKLQDLADRFGITVTEVNPAYTS
ncbi:MAG: hypothetical protein RL339_2004, partial [Pseudomonadota bacterium]